MIKRFTGAAAVLALALTMPGCSDPAAKAKAEAEAKAKSDGDAADRKLREKIAHNVECLSAIKWQQAVLAGAGIGPLDTYTGYFRSNIERAVGSKGLDMPAPAPRVSLATLDDYLAYAYPLDVKNVFTAGKDNNGDGTVSGFERSARGFNTVTGCIMEVAEVGNGPLAGKDKVGRMYRLKEIQAKLKDKDA